MTSRRSGDLRQARRACLGHVGLGTNGWTVAIAPPNTRRDWLAGEVGKRIETTEGFAPALARSLERKGIRMLHCVTDVEVITNQTTIAAIHAR